LDLDDAVQEVEERESALWEQECLPEEFLPRVRRPRIGTKPSGKAKFESPARFRAVSSNRKLSPVDVIPSPGSSYGIALKPRAPFCSSTYASIEATCSTDCPWKAGGCYAKAGITGMINARMDEAAAGKTELEVMREEARQIDAAFGGRLVPADGARGGRDLRLHVGGDASSEAGARALAGAAERWRGRRGGTVWTYSHSWRSVDRAAWGGISVLASVESAAEIEQARARGYASAIVVERFPKQHRVFSLPGSTAKIIPCPAETASVTCVKCRLCLDRDLLKHDEAIAFSLHGRDSGAARSKLRVLNGDQLTMKGI
jgi:hypothetical protein